MSRTVEQHFEMMEIFRAKMMKFGRQIFVTGGLHDGPWTIAGSSLEFPDSFYKPLVIKVRILELIISGQTIIKLCSIFGSMQLSMTESFTSRFVGNMVDVLPPAFSYDRFFHAIAALPLRIESQVCLGAPRAPLILAAKNLTRP